MTHKEYERAYLNNKLPQCKTTKSGIANESREYESREKWIKPIWYQQKEI